MSNAQVKSAVRAFEILEHFRLSQQPRTMSELSTDLGYPLSSTTVLLKTLVNLGYLNYDRVKRVYFPTTKVTGLGDWVPRALFGAGQVIDAMNDVHAITSEGVFVGTRNDVYLQYLKTKQSLHALRFYIDEGTVRPITLSAAGWVLLATMPDDKIENMVRRANIATQNPAERVLVPEIFKRIEEIRLKGYGWAEGVPFAGGATIAVLMPGTILGSPVTLALGGVAERVRKNFEKYLGALMTAARSAQRAPDFDTPIHIEL
ncbi:MAG: helix-turn-helix domain-containing protein [Rhodobacter sp.]|nr:helix-turn-helix domain-containing protein [Paracoccaceae bacterium]MCC0077375.1 helix-turn-helix domain-containing protein [Rhodobacter sp.]